MLAADDDKRGDFLRDATPTVLVDGIIAAAWAVERRKSAATLTVTPFAKLRKQDIAEIEHEAARFLRFMEESAESFEVRIVAPAG
jgi:hypothetical protein